MLQKHSHTSNCPLHVLVSVPQGVPRRPQAGGTAASRERALQPIPREVGVSERAWPTEGVVMGGAGGGGGAGGAVRC